MVSRLAHNQEIASSNLALATRSTMAKKGLITTCQRNYQ